MSAGAPDHPCKLHSHHPPPTLPQLEPFRLADEAGPSSRLALPAPPPAAPDPWLDVYAQNQLTRAGMGAGPLLAGGALSARAQRAAPRRLVVDVREFMAALPGVLHRQGFHLAPVTLEVGGPARRPAPGGARFERGADQGRCAARTPRTRSLNSRLPSPLAPPATHMPALN